MIEAIDLELLQSLFDCMPGSPFFVKDRQLRYVAANTAMLRLCGVDHRSELIGKSAADFFPEPLSRHYESLDRQILASGEPITDKLEASLARGRVTTWLMFSRLPVRARTGEVIGVVATSRRLGPGDMDHPAYARFARVLEHVRERFDERLNLGALAALAQVSRSQLERDFRRLLDMTPHQFLTRVRMERAFQCLDAGLSVTETALRCGYADHSAFTRKFREQMGRPPREYARRSGR
jgi:PAS domain S-box-containing protein